ncbi:MAG: hypothetical protein ABIH08_00870 [Candidatus Omnitrophota bacterium]
MQIDRRVIEKNLPPKGFIEENTHHKYFYHEYQGQRTGAYTYTSHGSKYKVYGVSLLKRMKKELKLDTIKQAADLFKCPISGEDYNNILQNKRMI